MLKTIVLICLVGTDPAACTVATAIDVLRVAPTSNGAMCGLMGQAGIAATAIAPEQGRTYQKIICQRDRG